MNSYKGMTLVELMIAVAIAAILLAVAAPSFHDLIVKSQIETLQNNFANAVITARTEATSRGRTIRVCSANAAATACGTNADWGRGWLVIEDKDDATPLVVFQNKNQSPAMLTTEAGVAANAISFNSQGYNASDTRFLFTACDTKKTAKFARGVMVEFSGRARVTSDVDSNGIHDRVFHEDSAAVVPQALTCPA
jgi:type IV fimbrial biogenesis protein FimT